MKETLIWFNLQRDGTENGLPNIKYTFAESLQLRMSVLHHSICIFKPGLSSSYDGCVKYKGKVPDVSSSGVHLNSRHHSHKKQKDGLEFRSYLLIFLLKLKIFGVAIKRRHQSSEKW